jgi:hypothetical protein
MAEIKSPLSGGLRVARRTVSADAFVRAAPPPPPAVSQPDPVTTSLIQRNSLALNTVSEQLTSLTQQVNSLNAAMQNVYGNITQNSILERRKEAQEQDQERRLAEQQLREGKESAIERKIQSALVYPVQKISAKASFTLSRLMQFFTTLLGGWLLNQGLETIKALGEGNKKRLTEIRDNVLKNLGIIGGIYAGIRFGLTAVFNAMTRVAARVTAAVAVGLFIRPVQALLDGVKGAADKLIPKIQNVLPGFSKPGGAGGGNPPPPAGGKEPPKTTSEASRQVGGKGFNRFSPSSLLAPLLGGAIGGTADVMQGEDPAKAYTTNLGGAAAATYATGLVSRLPLPPLIKVPLMFGTGYGVFSSVTEGLKGFYDKTTEMFGTDPGVTSSQPVQSKITDIAFNSEDLMGNREQANVASNTTDTNNLVEDEKSSTDLIAQASGQDFTQQPQYGNINVEQLLQTAKEFAGKVTDQGIEIAKGATTEAVNISPTKGLTPESINIPQAQVFPIKQEVAMKTASVGPLPEPTPTIIPMPMGGGTRTVAGKQRSTVTGEDTNPMPVINPENSNNIYLAFSHSVYNVPMM